MFIPLTSTGCHVIRWQLRMLVSWPTTTTRFALCSEKPSTSSSSPELVSAQHQACSTSRCVVHVAQGCKASPRSVVAAGCGVLSLDATKLASPAAFADNPSRVRQFYHYRREIARAAVPNAAHKAVALLSSSDELAKVAPSAQTFRLVTQNIDNLSTCALPPSAPASAYPIEMHGNVFRVECTECDFVELNFNSPICARLAGTEAERPPEVPKVWRTPETRCCLVWRGSRAPQGGRRND